MRLVVRQAVAADLPRQRPHHLYQCTGAPEDQFFSYLPTTRARTDVVICSTGRSATEAPKLLEIQIVNLHRVSPRCVTLARARPSMDGALSTQPRSRRVGQIRQRVCARLGQLRVQRARRQRGRALREGGQRAQRVRAGQRRHQALHLASAILQNLQHVARGSLPYAVLGFAWMSALHTGETYDLTGSPFPHPVKSGGLRVG